MALTPCDECGNQVAENAFRCPSCGNELDSPLKPSHLWRRIWLFIVILIVVYELGSTAAAGLAGTTASPNAYLSACMVLLAVIAVTLVAWWDFVD